MNIINKLHKQLKARMQGIILVGYYMKWNL